MLRLLSRLPPSIKARLLRTVDKLGAWPQRIRQGPGQGLILFAPLSRRLHFAYGKHEAHVARVIWERLGPGMTALDAGAHMGYFTLLMARRVGSRGHVFAFEPVTRLARLLRRSVARNRLSQVTVVQRALGRDATVARMTTGANDAMGYVSLDDPGAGPSVEVTTLDTWAASDKGPARLDLIKLDVEGFELEVLAGGAGLLESDQPDILCEVHWSQRARYRPRQLVDRLSDVGYRVRLLPRDGPPARDLEEVLRHTEATKAPQHMEVFHLLATRDA